MGTRGSAVLAAIALALLFRLLVSLHGEAALAIHDAPRCERARLLAFIPTTRERCGTGEHIH